MDFKKRQSDKILASYGIDIKKSQENDLEKGGEGSKGGKVIGHTKSGKPVYEHHEGHSYKHFTANDHDDASTLHFDLGTKYKEKEDHKNAHKHGLLSESHDEAWADAPDDDEDVEKSEENDLTKGRKASTFGTKSKDGKYMKTTTGWKRMETVKENGGHVEENIKPKNVFKANGLQVKKIERYSVSPLTNRTSSTSHGLFNDKGEIFALDGKPYFPIGGRAAFKSIVEDGLNHKGYSFVKYPNK